MFTTFERLFALTRPRWRRLVLLSLLPAMVNVVFWAWIWASLSAVSLPAGASPQDFLLYGNGLVVTSVDSRWTFFTVNVVEFPTRHLVRSFHPPIALFRTWLWVFACLPAAYWFSRAIVRDTSPMHREEIQLTPLKPSFLLLSRAIPPVVSLLIAGAAMWTVDLCYGLLAMSYGEGTNIVFSHPPFGTRLRTADNLTGAVAFQCSLLPLYAMRLGLVLSAIGFAGLLSISWRRPLLCIIVALWFFIVADPLPFGHYILSARQYSFLEFGDQKGILPELCLLFLGGNMISRYISHMEKTSRLERS